MPRVRAPLAAIALCLSCLAAPQARAQDASFGCKVLLCAAASAPSWSGIPYCVPIMQQLFRSLRHGGSWPSCPEGHASGLGYEPYYPCPAGMTAAQRASDGNLGVIAWANGNLCADMTKPSNLCAGGRDSFCTTTYPMVSRQARSEPDYVDITTASGVQRFYFSLRGS